MTDEQTAAQLVSFGQCSTDAEFEAAIVRALQAARKECMDADDVDLVAPTPEVVSTFRTKAPPGHIIDDAGVVRRVLGVLPVTADGCVAAPGGVIWPQLLIDNDEGGRVAWSLYDICTGDTCDDGEWLADKCWSTKEAAEAAKEGKA